MLLDAAAMGVNVVEREGISFSHPARFILVGTMNPEEGDLRPQLLDRFALSVDITGIRDARDRVTIIENTPDAPWRTTLRMMKPSSWPNSHAERTAPSPSPGR